jgi:6-phosphogluconolactonase (cycloisomerase 2 family)
VLDDNGGDALNISGNGPFTFATAATSGSAYSVTIETQPTDPTLHCIVMNAGRSGTVQNSDVTTVAVQCAKISQLAYVTYYDSTAGQTVSLALAIDPVHGSQRQLSQSQTAVGAGLLAPSLPGGSYAYAAGNGGIEGFALDPATGAVATLAGSPFGVGLVNSDCGGCSAAAQVALLAVEPRGQYLYAYYDQWGPCCPEIPVVSTLVGFSIDAATGALTALPVPTAPGGSPTASMAIDPGGRFLYSSEPPNNHILSAGGTRHFLIDRSTGALTEGSLEALWGWPLSFEPSGAFAYTVETGTAGLQALTIDSDTGALTAVGSVAAAPGLTAVAVDPAGAFAYGGCTGGLCAFSLDAVSGVVTALAGSPYATGTSPSSLAFDASGKFLLGLCGAAVCVYVTDPVTGVPAAVPADSFPLSSTESLALLVVP